jgi:gamma-glutamyl-gamma-aminobutyrate hydrolase PuuD
MKIGLTQRVLTFPNTGIVHDALEHGWYKFLKGHELIPIPNREDLDYETLSDELDLLIITGGRNDDIRIITEVGIATEMVTEGKPVLGICHGAFLLTSILGGYVEGDKIKEQHYITEHNVFYDGRPYWVNSYHDIWIAEPPPGSVVLATDPEGDCESWYKNNIGAIVWHPERMEKPFIPTEILEVTGL